MKSIQLAKDLSLPADTAPAQRFAFIGRVGSGKTYASGKFVELLYDSGRQVVVVDPVGNWGRGLRLAANGKDRGLDIPIFGGANADVPLEPTGGKLIADVVVEHRASMVLDVSEMTYGEQCRFMADFASHLLQRKKGAKSPLMLVVEEAQEFIPERTFKSTAVMVGAMTRLVKLGRNYGIGFALITQRPQAVSKEVLNLTEALFVFQTSGPQERKTIAGWVSAKGLDLRDQLDELPSLDPGDGFLWSPQWLKTFRKVRVLPKRTFDASATPTEVELHAELKPIDLKQITAAMAETIERTKLDDPKALRAENARLKRELEKSSSKPAAAAGIDKAALRKTIDEAVAAESEKFSSQWTANMKSYREAVQARFEKLINDLKRSLKRTLDGLETIEVEKLMPPAPTGPLKRRATGPLRYETKPVAAARSSVASASAGDSSNSHHRLKPVPLESWLLPSERLKALVNGGVLAKGERRVLTAIAQYPNGIRREQITVLTDYKKTSRDTYLKSLRQKGCLEERGDLFLASEAGMAALGDFEPLPTGDALRAHYLQTLPQGERVILDIVIAEYPEKISRDEICERSNYKKTSRDTYLKKLAAKEIVIVDRDGVRASDDLFDSN